MISILITHYKRPEKLEKCLLALKKIDFENRNVEIIVADDGSDSKTQDFLKSLQVDTLLLSEKNMGLASNLNKGLKACAGNYILYIQEDFIVSPDFNEVVVESVKIINEGKLDMIRFCANYRFKHLVPISNNINRIPKFSFRNFNVNIFQYSDNPFMATREFFEKFGYFLENTSGGYGETEYAIRILNSSAKIGISNKYYFKHSKGVSVMDVDLNKPKLKPKKGLQRKIYRFTRAGRQYLEWLLYNSNNRKLVTYINKRSPQ